MSPSGSTVVVIAVLTTCFVLSAVTGIEKGVQFLSNANAIAALLLVFFLFVVGPTVFILSTFTESLGGYLTHLPTMAFRTGAFGGSEFLDTWTIFYWAWWISWTPFVGMFIARISKGRTIRQFVVYVILVPSLVSFVWFSILAGSAFDLQLSGAKDLGAVLARRAPRAPCSPRCGSTRSRASRSCWRCSSSRSSSSPAPTRPRSSWAC